MAQRRVSFVLEPAAHYPDFTTAANLIVQANKKYLDRELYAARHLYLEAASVMFELHKRTGINSLLVRLIGKCFGNVEFINTALLQNNNNNNERLLVKYSPHSAAPEKTVLLDHVEILDLQNLK
jgi:hypothetical protein